VTPGGDLILASGEGGVDKLLEPLSREIHLLDTYVAGTSYLEDRSVLAEIGEGDKLFLLRENENNLH